jgi:hypothetical protein
LNWRIAILISAAIAVSYLDRQTLPVAIAAIQQDIPISNTEFSQLQAAFLVAYALMYAGGGKFVDEFAALFAGVSDADIDALMASFRFEHCVQRAELAGILAADART